MSALVTEAHRQAAVSIFELAMKSSHHGAPFREPCAQLIADSEARAVEQANTYVESLLSAAKNAIPASEHPAEPTVENWAWQIRNLGEDRRLVYADRDKLRAEVKESKERERVAIASWDEERQRALREGERVEKLAGELAAAKAECERLHKAGTDTWRELRQQIHAKDAALARLRAAIDAAMKEGAT